MRLSRVSSHIRTGLYEGGPLVKAIRAVFKMVEFFEGENRGVIGGDLNESFKLDMVSHRGTDASTTRGRWLYKPIPSFTQREIGAQRPYSGLAFTNSDHWSKYSAQSLRCANSAWVKTASPFASLATAQIAIAPISNFAGILQAHLGRPACHQT